MRPALLLAALMAAGPAVADDCGIAGRRVTVEGGAAARSLICEGIERAVGFFAACGLAPPGAVHVLVRPQVIHPCGIDVFGLYDAATDRIHLTEPGECRRELAAAGALETLAFEEHYRSLVAHETAHFLLVHGDPGRRVPLLAHEYVATVVQVAALSPEGRRRVLATVGHLDPMETDAFSLSLLATHPDLFALQAYRHWARQPDRCGFLQRIAAGAPVFRRSPRE